MTNVIITSKSQNYNGNQEKVTETWEQEDSRDRWVLYNSQKTWEDLFWSNTLLLS